jgi:hypothetical protein
LISFEQNVGQRLLDQTPDAIGTRIGHHRVMISISESMTSARPNSSIRLRILSILELITWGVVANERESDLGPLMHVVGPRFGGPKH